MADRLLDRLEDCRRTFERAVVLGGAGAKVAERLSGGRAGIQVRAGSVTRRVLAIEPEAVEVSMLVYCSSTAVLIWALAKLQPRSMRAPTHSLACLPTCLRAGGCACGHLSGPTGPCSLAC